MMYLDLAELDRVFAGTRWWSARRPAPARFRREDFLGDPDVPLDRAVRQTVQRQTGVYPRGPVRLLANLRYFGYIINPISCYYCFDEAQRLQYIVAQVNNTPWDERHSYVLPCEPNRALQRIQFQKQLHVSPFHPMAMEYRWLSDTPGEKLRIHLQNWTSETGEGEQATLAFDATLALTREAISPAKLNRLLVAYPFMTLKVVAAIYWEACKLFCKRVPIFAHPGRATADEH